ncbi:MAG: hypothetical protein KDK25_11795 [Leptospiraceae bacterium]|nr:hypothetical protein [Leptospiraceae bacterium]
MKRYSAHLRRIAFVSVLLSGFCMPSCSEGPLQDSIPEFHEQERWNAYDIIRFDLTLKSADHTGLEATFWLDPALSRARMETPSGTTVVFDGAHFYAAGPELKRARFHVLTWPYFLAVPYKLRDPGTEREAMQPTAMNGKRYPTMRLSFRSGVGDTPDDWYIVYQDPDTHRLHGMAYIVTYAKGLQDAESNPHAIRYHDYEQFEGIPIATRWTFHPWNGAGQRGAPEQRAGATSDMEVISEKVLMEARLNNFAFYDHGRPAGRNEAVLPAPPDRIFAAPANARRLPEP